MNFDDDDFDPVEFSEEDAEKDFEELNRRADAHPLNRKAYEILELIEALYGLTTDDMGRAGIETMRQSSHMLITKLASGLRTESYHLAMQNAAIIRYHAEYLRLSNHSLKEDVDIDERYIRMFREEMENFRLLFREWVATFGTLTRYGDDEWGLFN
jgi:hypothetical protein